MKVLHAIASMAGGGAERQLCYLATELGRRGHEVHVALVHPEGPHYERLVRSGATLHPLRPRGHYDPRLFAGMVGLLRRLNPAVVQTWLPMMDIVAGAAARYRRGAPLVLSERNSRGGPTDGWKGRIRRAIGRRADALVANSTAGREYWRHRGVASSRLHVIRNALPLSELASIEPARPGELGLRPNVRFVLVACRLEGGKNLSTVVSAFARLTSEDGVPDSDDGSLALVVLGEGPERPALERQVGRLGIGDRVVFGGFRSDVWSWMRGASVFVNASRHEGMPNTVMEAMALGCPVVLSSIAEHHEIATPTMATFAPVDDDRQLAGILAGLLGEPERAAGLAAAAKRHAASWSVATMGDAYERLYRALAAGR